MKLTTFQKFNEKSQAEKTPEEFVEEVFQRALQRGESSYGYLGKPWSKISTEYHLYDEFYLYKGHIFKWRDSDDGAGYSMYLTRLDYELGEFKNMIYDKITELEAAFNKLP